MSSALPARGCEAGGPMATAPNLHIGLRHISELTATCHYLPPLFHAGCARTCDPDDAGGHTCDARPLAHARKSQKHRRGRGVRSSRLLSQ